MNKVVFCVYMVALTILQLNAAIFYVDALRPDDTGVGTSWTTAKKTIQAAVDLAADGDTVFVTNGVYDVGTTPTPGYSVNNRVVITNDIVVSSVNGPEETIIKGGGTNAYNSSAVVRCVFMQKGTLDGFTLMDGATYSVNLVGSEAFDRCGGGINMYNCDLSTIATNCIIMNCMAYKGGGSYYGNLYSSIIEGNAAGDGGGTYYGNLENNIISNNVSLSNGGGACYGTLSNCQIVDNEANGDGGGSYYTTLNNCSLKKNTASDDGGGSYYGSLNNCLLSGNIAVDTGGGTYSGTLINCTLSGNTAVSGAGSYGGSIQNCIVWANNKPDGTFNNYYSSSFYYSCTAPLPSGSGNIASDPMFVDLKNPRLRIGSPCIDTGNNSYMAFLTDLDGNQRIQNGTVDMGAYEGGVAATELPVFDPPSGTVFTNSLDVGITCATEGSVIRYTLDDSEPTQNSTLYTGPINLISAITVKARAFKDGLYSSGSQAEYRPGVYFVDALSVSDDGAGSSWATAKKTIQAAVDLAVEGDTVYVTNGVYDIGSRVTPGYSVSNRLVIAKSVTVSSMNGPDVTIIEGSGTNLYNSSSAVRCVYMKKGVLNGFTLRNGSTFGSGISGNDQYDRSGGGINIYNAAAETYVTNCIINNCAAYRGGGAAYATLKECFLLNNTANESGGGAYSGTLISCTVEGNSSLGDGGGSRSSTLNSCILSSNTAVDDGGGAYYGSLDDCILTNNLARSEGGGAYSCTLNSCVLSANSAYSGGGSSYNCTLNYCLLQGNSATLGGGSYSCTLNYCRLMDNTATSNGGGSYSGTLNNSTLTYNEAGEAGGGSYSATLINCTVAANVAVSGGGTYGGTVKNCIVWANTKLNGTINNHLSSSFYYSCTTPLPSGTGNIAVDPQLVDYQYLRLRTGSPCIDTGNNSYMSLSKDLAGNTRILTGTIDMGAYEGGESASAMPVFSPPSGTLFAQSLEVSITCATEGASIRYTLDGSEPTEVSPLYTEPVLLTTDTTIIAQSLKAGILSSRAIASYRPGVYYVDASRPDDSGEGSSWATAKKTIQAALNLTVDNDIIYVTNGVYNVGTTVTPGYSVSNRVVITNAVTVRSINGPEATIIEGSGSGYYNTPQVIRCVYMNDGVLAGFTLLNGATYGTAVSGSDQYDRRGGGVNMYNANLDTMITNCIVRNCTAYNGGGVTYGTVNNCTLLGNTALLDGGGSYYGTLNNCVLRGNIANDDGGGSYYGALNNCMLIDNMANDAGGGSHYGTLNNCTLTQNTANYTGGGSYYGTLRNCIVWDNTKSDASINNYLGSAFSYSCTTPLPSGTGNIDSEPLFVDLLNLRLRSGSPCVDSGNNSYATFPADLDGSPRIQNGTVDMGAYEGGVAATALPVFDPPSGTQFTNTLEVVITCVTEGAVIRYTLDGSAPDESSAEYTGPIIVDQMTTIEARAFKEGYYSSGSSATYRPCVYYVDASRPDNSGIGTSWATAKKTIQDAVELTEDGDTVFVTNGVYNAGGAVTPGHSVSNRVVITRNIQVSSVNGPTVTIIEGSGTNMYNTLSAVRCVYMKKGKLNGFALLNGSTYGPGMSGSDNYDRYGGGVNMYGAEDGTSVSNCLIQLCKAQSGGGVCNGDVINSILSSNTASYVGGGVINGTLENCELTYNCAFERAGGSYGGVLNNCTLAFNLAPSGGGSYSGTLRNCIVWGNENLVGSVNNHYSSTFLYSCTTPLPSGTGNIADDPQFASSEVLRLRDGSPCIDTGNNSYVTMSEDLIGNQRIQNGAVDMGAYEGGVTSTAYPVFEPPSGTLFTNTLAVTITCATEGASIRYTLDGSEPTEESDLYDGPIVLSEAATIKARTFKEGYYPSGSSAAYRPCVFYVDASRPDDSSTGTSWAMAKKTIQAAVDLAVDGDTVFVTNGLYNTGVAITPGYSVSNRVVIARNIQVCSINGPDVTVIEGSGANLYDTSSALRCVYMSRGVLNGFTLQKGETYGVNMVGSDYYDRSGGGINMYNASSGTYATNCVIRDCHALYGGGVYYSTLYNCNIEYNYAVDDGGGSYYGIINNSSLIGNIAKYDGGASYYSTLNDCSLLRNEAKDDGGGSYYGTLSNCSLTGNTANDYGGGSYNGSLNNCFYSENSAHYGGGTYYGTVNNSTLTGNTAYQGGGCHNSTLNNCVLSGNSAVNSGGGAYSGTLRNCRISGNISSNVGGGASSGSLINCSVINNIASSGAGVNSSTLKNCIVWENTLGGGSVGNHANSTFYYSCTLPLPLGTGNVAENPQFVDQYNLQLREGSSCIDAGDNSYVTLEYDLGGNTRVQNGVVDMGAYEGGVLATAIPVFDPPSGTLFGDALEVSIACATEGVAIYYTLDGSEPTETNALYTAPLLLTTAVTVKARAFKAGMVSSEVSAEYRPGLFFVDASRPDNSGAGTSWATAKKTIQAAVDIALDDDTVFVTNGIYNIGTTVTPGYVVSNRVVITNAVTVRSVNGPEVTVIEGSGTEYYYTSSAVRCVYMSKGRIEGFTLQNGATGLGSSDIYDRHGGGINMYNSASETSASNCVIRNCRGYVGGGSYYSVLYNCTLTGNIAYDGGGCRSGTLNNCMLTENMASNSGGGSCYGILNNCILSGNTASSGGGSFRGTLNNCTLIQNIAAYGAGSYDGSLRNCIVWNNLGVDGGFNNYYNSSFNYSCTTPLPDGTGNIDADPMFVDTQNHSLRIGSPCINSGDNNYAELSIDLAGNPRIQNGTVDMGAYEGGVDAVEIPVFDPPSGTLFTNSLEVAVTCATAGVSIRYTLDGSDPAESSTLYTGPIQITAASTITVRAFKDGLVSSGSQAAYRPNIFYVDASRPDDSEIGTSWATAKRTIQAAVHLAVDGDTVLVTNGVYNSGVTMTPGYTLNNRLVITKAVTVRSMNGPAGTVIEGSGPEFYNTSSAIRCVYMSNGILDGFTLQGGATYSTGLGTSEYYEWYGGGISMYNSAPGTIATNCVIRNCRGHNGGGSCYANLNSCALSENTARVGGGSYYGTLNNCTLTGNTANYNAGGSYYAILNDCTLKENMASEGGGSYYGTLNNCMLTGNTAGSRGGGSMGGTLYGCTLTGNTASSNGGGSYGSTLSNCLLTWNTAYRGGGAYGDTLSNCVVTDNTANYGGGSYGCTMNNCTLIRNIASFYGAGSYSGTLKNCIIWNNYKTGSVVDNYYDSTFYYSCTEPLPSGTGNINSYPEFIDSFNLQLRASSPCVDAGDNGYTNTIVDIAGNPRVQNGTVDMGAYEGGVLATCIPVFDPPDGTRFTNSVTVSINCSTEGAVLHYTLDGSEPTGTNEVYTVDLVLSGSTTVRVKAFKDGFVAAQALAYYAQYVVAPVISPVSGTIATNELTVTIGCGTDQAVIHYTLDGSIPTENSPVYTNSITLTQSATIRAIAFKDGLEDSEITTAAYTVMQTVGTPQFMPESGTVATNSMYVWIECPVTPWAEIHYTTDGSEPTIYSPVYYSYSPVYITETTTIKAKAFYYGMADSETASAVYTIVQTVATPVLLPADGTLFLSLRKVTMSCATDGAEIRYTLDGSEPTSQSLLYSSAFNIFQTTTFTVKAFKNGMADSATVSATYYRLPELNEALDVTDLSFVTGGDANWFSQTVVTHDNVDAAQSGAITHNQSSWIETTVTGPGTFTFWRKTSCENDPDADNWDYLLFTVDGIERSRVDGETQWQQVTCLLEQGTHILRWGYHKDESISEGSDCAWIDQLSFVPDGQLPTSTSTTPVPVPYSWLDQYPVLMSQASGDYEVAGSTDVDGDGHAAWQEYITGSVPTNRDSVLRASIAVSNDTHWITWTPDLGSARIYTVIGKSNLYEKVWSPTNSASRYFKVRVDMP